MIYFDRTGRPAVLLTSTEVRKVSGALVGLVDGDVVYNLNGRVMGWHADGWIFDRRNRHVFFRRDAIDGPPRPTIPDTVFNTFETPAFPDKVEGITLEPPPEREWCMTVWSPFSRGRYFRQ